LDTLREELLITMCTQYEVSLRSEEDVASRVSKKRDSSSLQTNTALSRAAFYQQRTENEGWVFSAVITEYHLSHLAWLMSPLDAQNLARTEILSSCHAAMRPPQAMWRRYIAESID